MSFDGDPGVDARSARRLFPRRRKSDGRRFLEAVQTVSRFARRRSTPPSREGCRDGKECGCTAADIGGRTQYSNASQMRPRTRRNG